MALTNVMMTDDTVTNSGADYDVFGGLGVKIYLNESEDFLKVKETLTRVGIESQSGVIDQVCYILHKKGEYAIMHWKEMRMLDGEEVVMTEDEVAQRNTISQLLHNWELVDVDDLESIKRPRAERGSIKVVPYRDKAKYILSPLYHIGRSK